MSERQREKLKLHEKDGDGESWMSYEEFAKQFEEVSICTRGPDFDGDGDVDQFERVRALLF